MIAGSQSPPESDEPVIVATALGAGHDGRAEAVVDVRYPNGAVHSVTMTEEAVAAALTTTGADRLDDLVGRPWTVLVGTPPGT